MFQECHSISTCMERLGRINTEKHLNGYQIAITEALWGRCFLTVLEIQTILQMCKKFMGGLKVMNSEENFISARSVVMKEREDCVGTQKGS